MNFIKNNKIWIVISILFVIFFLIISFGIYSLIKSKKLVELNKTTIQTKEYKLYEFVGPECEGCDLMEETYNKAKEKYSDSLEFEEVDVTLNINLTNKYNINTIPSYIIVDKEGNVKKRETGYIEEEEFFKLIEDVIFK